MGPRQFQRHVGEFSAHFDIRDADIFIQVKVRAARFGGTRLSLRHLKGLINLG